MTFQDLEREVGSRETQQCFRFKFLMKKIFFIFLLGALMTAMWPGENAMADTKKAYFAGGCFWCMEKPFEETAGVTQVDSGYVNSKTPNPTYEEVSEGVTGAYEAVEVVYNPSKVSFEDLLNVYWTTIDPTQSDGQFNDRGSQYLTGIFYQNDEEKMIAQESKKILEEAKVFKKPITVDILEFKNWTRAEEYHQDYYKKNATHYNAYSIGSGRKGFLENQWGKKPYCPLRKISLTKIKTLQEEAKKV